MSAAEKLSPVELKRKFVNSFTVSTMKTFEIQAITPLQQGEPYVKKNESETDYFIAAILNYSDSQISGSVTMAMTKKALLKVYQNMFEEDVAEFDEEMRDAVGELLNIIYGGAKKDLNANYGFSLPMAIPQVILGNSTGYDYEKHTIVAQPFDIAPEERVFIEFYFGEVD